MAPPLSIRGPDGSDIRRAIAQAAASLAGISLEFTPDASAKTLTLQAGSVSLTSCAAIARYLATIAKARSVPHALLLSISPLPPRRRVHAVRPAHRSSLLLSDTACPPLRASSGASPAAFQGISRRSCERGV